MLDGYLWIAQSPLVWAAIGFWLVLFILNNVAIPVERARAGSARFEAWFRAHIWETVVAVILAPFLLLAVSELITLWETKPDPREPSVTPGDLRWHASLIVAMLGAIGGIFTIFFATIRAAATERQTRTAEAQHDHDNLVQVNQRIQNALELLSARTRETRIGRTVLHEIDGGTDSVLQWQDEGPHDLTALVKPQAQPWTAFERDVPDVQSRLSGIGQLDAIRKETDGRGRAINEHLANFIRANAPATVAHRHPAQKAPGEEVSRDRKERINALRGWARSLVSSADIQAAFALIGRSTGESTTSGLDLRRISAQGVELPAAHLQKCLLSDAHLEGANLVGASLEGAELRRAHLEGANLGGRIWRGRTSGGCIWKGRYYTGRVWRGRTSGRRVWRGRSFQWSISRVQTLQGPIWRARGSSWRIWTARSSLIRMSTI